MPEVEIRLRGLEPRDRDPIVRILSGAGVFRDEEVAVGLELVDESLHPRPDTDYAWFVAEVGVELAGFACYGPVPLTDATYDLYWIAVAPAFRGSPVAARLDDAVTSAVSALGGRWLLAETSSTPPYEPARRFYLKRGYEVLSVLPDFYRLGDDRVTYGKRLDRP
jgi:ribosomal protein S18 acetylase RimI-like enzyme